MNLCKIVGLLLFIGALTFALLGLYFVNYTTEPDANYPTPSDYPYLKYIIPSAIIAIVLFISGTILFLARAETKEATKYCQYCDSENKSDAVFCVKCGKQID